MNRSTPDFTFAARDVGRHVYRPRRLPFWRCLLIVAVMATAGVYLMLAATGTAHAGERDQVRELQAAAERLHDECRDNPRAAGACAAREVVLAQLKADGRCWNSRRNPTGASDNFWSSCGREGDGLGGRMAPCDLRGVLAARLANARDAGVPPREAYEGAVRVARSMGGDVGPLQALTWQVYADLAAYPSAGAEAVARYECRRARGQM